MRPLQGVEVNGLRARLGMRPSRQRDLPAHLVNAGKARAERAGRQACPEATLHHGRRNGKADWA
jgi:hypothetical protein